MLRTHAGAEGGRCTQLSSSKLQSYVRAVLPADIAVPVPITRLEEAPHPLLLPGARRITAAAATAAAPGHFYSGRHGARRGGGAQIPPLGENERSAAASCGHMKRSPAHHCSQPLPSLLGAPPCTAHNCTHYCLEPCPSPRPLHSALLQGPPITSPPPAHIPRALPLSLAAAHNRPGRRADIPRCACTKPPAAGLSIHSAAPNARIRHLWGGCKG